MKGIDMKRIRLEVILSIMIIFLFAGYAKSAKVEVKHEPQAKQPMEQKLVTLKKPDSTLWQHLGKTRSGDCYFSKKLITQTPDHIISVEIYKIVTEDFRNEIIERIKKTDLAKSVKYQNYEYNIHRDDIDCQKSMYRVKESVDYDDKGNILDSVTYTTEQWKSFPVLSGHDSIREKLCVAQKKPLKKKK